MGSVERFTFGYDVLSSVLKMFDSTVGFELTLLNKTYRLTTEYEIKMNLCGI